MRTETRGFESSLPMIMRTCEGHRRTAERQSPIRSRRSGILLVLLLASHSGALALNPALNINQYAHWKSGDNSTKVGIWSITQGPDGYLWLGTEFGVERFDGIQTVPLHLGPGQNLPSDMIASLLFGRDGTFWIGTWKGLASLKAGRITTYPELAGRVIVSLVEDHAGVIWAAAGGSLCAIRGGGVQCYRGDGKLDALGLYEDRAGNLWAGTATGVSQWKSSGAQFYALPGESLGIQGLTGDESGALLVAARGRVARLVGGKWETAYAYPAAARQSFALKMLRDHDGGLWVGTVDRGLVHIHQGRIDTYSEADGLSGVAVRAMYEDHEGNVWIATPTGLDRFRDFAAPPYGRGEGIPDGVVALVGTQDGSVWLGGDDGVARWRSGAVLRMNESRLPRNELMSLLVDHLGRIWIAWPTGVGYIRNGTFVRTAAATIGIIGSMAEDTVGKLWMASTARGLIEFDEGGISKEIPWTKLTRTGPGKKGFATALVADASGGLWAGYYLGGLQYLKDGEVRASYTSASGLGDGSVTHLRVDQEGAVWASTEGGLSRLKDGRIATLSHKNSLPCDTVIWTIEDDSGAMWVNTTCGLVRIAQSELDAWAANPVRTVRNTILGATDGVGRRSAMPTARPNVTRSLDGRIWFTALQNGISVMDPRHLPFNNVPPPVHIEEITADGKIYWQNSAGVNSPDDASSHLRLPVRTHDLEIDYTALSLVVPEKLRFRYKLEGKDDDWRDAGARRKAFYNDLRPRTYRFRVIACNNSSVWNEVGDTLEFSIAPAYFQTRWFQASGAAAFLALVWGLYRYRLRQIAREFNVRLEERVSERTRLARDLHDTLLQSFHGLMLHLQTVSKLLPAGKAKEQLEQTMERADRAIAEGRSAVYDLRLSATLTNDLAEAVNAVGNELSSDNDAVFNLMAEGPTRDLHPIVRDEIYRISREALSNAFKHAHASQIEVEISYGPQAFRIRIRDDGEGIPEEILDQGRTGHY